PNTLTYLSLTDRAGSRTLPAQPLKHGMTGSKTVFYCIIASVAHRKSPVYFAIKGYHHR
ncbi:hypothetical protein FB639_006360, partial [Coemansia asiatica]